MNHPVRRRLAVALAALLALPLAACSAAGAADPAPPAPLLTARSGTNVLLGTVYAVAWGPEGDQVLLRDDHLASLLTWRSVATGEVATVCGLCHAEPDCSDPATVVALQPGFGCVDRAGALYTGLVGQPAHTACDHRELPKEGGFACFATPASCGAAGELCLAGTPLGAAGAVAPPIQVAIAP